MILTEKYLNLLMDDLIKDFNVKIQYKILFSVFIFSTLSPLGSMELA